MPADQNAPADLSQIKAALTAHAQKLELEWNDPATEEAIARVESELGVVLPADYRALLLWHNGTDDREFTSTEEILEIAEDMLDTAEMIEEDDPDYNLEPETGRLTNGAWNREWVAIYDYGDGRFDVLDLNPGPKGTAGHRRAPQGTAGHRRAPQGTAGQIFTYDPDAGEFEFHDSLATWAMQLEDGEEIEFL